MRVEFTVVMEVHPDDAPLIKKWDWTAIMNSPAHVVGVVRELTSRRPIQQHGTPHRAEFT